MSNESPSRAGWRIIQQNPKLFLVEIIWRWSFGLVALLMLLQAFASALQRVTISDADWAALHTLDLTQAASAAANVLLAFWRVFCLVLAALVPALAVAWMMAATWGRAATLRILQKSSGAAAVAGSNLLRIFLLLLAAIIAVLVIAGAALFSTRFSASPSEPNVALYFLIVLIALPVIMIVWAILNWVLSLAPLFSVRESRGVFGGLAATLRSLRCHREAFWSVSAVYGTVRGIALIAVIVLGLVLGALGENRIVLGLLVALLLVYFAFADLLYIARLAAYLQIAEQTSSTAGSSQLSGY